MKRDSRRRKRYFVLMIEFEITRILKESCDALGLVYTLGLMVQKNRLPRRELIWRRVQLDSSYFVGNCICVFCR